MLYKAPQETTDLMWPRNKKRKKVSGDMEAGCVRVGE